MQEDMQGKKEDNIKLTYLRRPRAEDDDDGGDEALWMGAGWRLRELWITMDDP